MEYRYLVFCAKKVEILDMFFVFLKLTENMENLAKRLRRRKGNVQEKAWGQSDYRNHSWCSSLQQYVCGDGEYKDRSDVVRQIS